MSLVTGSEATIHYEQTGQGPDIVWISGGGDTGSRWHKYQTPFFDDAFRSTTFDGASSTLGRSIHSVT